MGAGFSAWIVGGGYDGIVTILWDVVGMMIRYSKEIGRYGLGSLEHLLSSCCLIERWRWWYEWV